MLAEIDAKHVIKEVVEGLNYLHKQNVMHRDIKLDNVLVNLKPARSGSKISDFEFKLGDMGLARQNDSPNSLADTYAGTPLAMPPELLNREQYGFKADVWSLGTLLF